MTQGQFHHLVIARDEPGTDDLTLWLDGVEQWNITEGAENAVANFADNVLHFFTDDGGSENPTGYVDFIRIYDGAVNQSEVNAMVVGLPQYGTPELLVNKITGEITLNSNNGAEPLNLRGYQLSSPSGQLDTVDWTSWDDGGLDGDSWFEANPSATQLAELNVTSSAALSGTTSRSFGNAYSGGIGGTEDLVFEYLEPNNGTPIIIPVRYSPEIVFTVGDLDFDTDIDGTDWELYIAGLGKELTGMTMADAFQMGDMDDDFDNDYQDFLLFKDAYEQANGVGSLAQLLTVPEPSFLFLVVPSAICALSLAGRNRSVTMFA